MQKDKGKVLVIVLIMIGYQSDEAVKSANAILKH